MSLLDFFRAPAIEEPVENTNKGKNSLAAEVSERLNRTIGQSLMMPADVNFSDVFGGNSLASPLMPGLPFLGIDDALIPVVTGKDERFSDLKFDFRLKEREELCKIAQHIVKLCGKLVKNENRFHPDEKIGLKDALVDLINDKDRKIVNDAIPGFEQFTQDKELFCWMSAVVYIEARQKKPTKIQEAHKSMQSGGFAQGNGMV